MSLTKKVVLAAVLVAAAVFVAAAAADHGGRSHGHGSHEHGKVLRMQLVGSILSDPPIHGVTRGAVPWVGTGTATLDRHGRFKVRIRGLVIPTLGNPGPVTSLKFSLFCAPDSSGPVFTTDSTPLSSRGNARLKQHVTVPQRCLAPVVLAHPNGNLAAYIAASGFLGVS
jgi:hypothetical protein